MFDLSDFEIVESITAEDGTVVEIVQYPQLIGSADLRTAESLFYASQSGMHLKMVRIQLNGTNIRLEPGTLYFMKGDLEIKTSTGGGIVKGLARKAVSREKFFVNEIKGVGEIYLEPTFGHFLLHRIGAGEGGVIVDKSLFYAGTSGLDISAAIQKNISSALFGGEGLFQTKISGTGVAILYSPVPQDEIIRYDLAGDKLSVDGNFALMRSANVKFRAEKSSKTWTATAVSGEGLLQTFSGDGFVWIAPTQGIYDQLTQISGIQSLTAAIAKSNTKTKSG